MAAEAEMAEILARCGFRCDLCPAYAPNVDMMVNRQAVSDGWFRYFGFRLPPEEIYCTGCAGEGKTLDKDCQIRACVIAKGLENCASCEDFDCEKMKSRVDAAAKIRKKFPDMPKRDYALLVRPFEGRKRLVRLREGGR
ncbi:MAG: DUF3795 domain-containing protein [Acidobacteria bacterium]|nr:MAG: DUF3795 domain-containing protein [Acidobacteriota bacterium]